MKSKPDYIKHYNKRRDSKEKRINAIFNFIENIVKENSQIPNMRIEILLKKELGITCSHQTIKTYRNQLESIGKVPIRKSKYTSFKSEDKILIYHTVYFIEAVGTNLCKIGYSQELIARAKQLMTVNANSLKIIGYIENSSPKLETDLHLKFDSINHHGDWFHLTKELKSFIDINARKDDLEIITQQSQPLKKSRSPSGISLKMNKN